LVQSRDVRLTVYNTSITTTNQSHEIAAMPN
jgi:hypothetical protein